MEDTKIREQRLNEEIAARQKLESLLAEKSQELDETNKELQESSEALWESSMRFRTILNNVPAGVILTDSKGVIETINYATEAMFGYDETEIAGMEISQLLPRDGDRERAQLESTNGQEMTAETVANCVGRKRNELEFPCEVAIKDTLVLESDRLIWIILDQTTRQKEQEEKSALEDELRHAQKLEALGTLAGGVAHEINTPIQYVGDNTRFIKEAFESMAIVLDSVHSILDDPSESSLEKLKETLRSAWAEADVDFLRTELPAAIEQSLDGVERVSEIVKAIKDFSHPNAKEKTRNNINKFIENTITVASNQWKYVANVEAELDPALPEIYCLSGEFNQVILNLLMNAVDAIAELKDEQKGVIKIASRQAGDWVEITISDTGNGIPEDKQAKIFDPFFTTKAPGKGTGQGLAISHTIITKKHGGTIGFESEVGKGTTFTIKLPIADSVEPGAV